MDVMLLVLFAVIEMFLASVGVLIYAKEEWHPNLKIILDLIIIVAIIVIWKNVWPMIGIV